MLFRSRGTVRDFLRVHQEAPPEAPPRCKELEKVLGELFATRDDDPPPPPPPDADIFSVQFSEPVTREIDEASGEVVKFEYVNQTDRIHAEIYKRILNGGFQPGQTVHELPLAKELSAHRAEEYTSNSSHGLIAYAGIGVKKKK